MIECIHAPCERFVNAERRGEAMDWIGLEELHSKSIML
jgi:hypothetical protein